MKPDRRLRGYVRKHRDLGKSISEIGFTWPGTIESRKLKCGKSLCACHSDPDSKHGPYFYWTTKIASKTVSKMLTESEAQTLKEWIQNRKKLEQTLKEMRKLSQKTAAILFPDKHLIRKLSS